MFLCFVPANSFQKLIFAATNSKKQDETEQAVGAIKHFILMSYGLFDCSKLD